MPYIWVDDPIAFASGREVYGFAKTQGWMHRLGDPRGDRDSRPPDPPESLALDVYGAADEGPESELGRRRLITISRQGARRAGTPPVRSHPLAEGNDLSSLLAHFISELDPSSGACFAPPLSGPCVCAARRAHRTFAELFDQGRPARLPQAVPRCRARRARRPSAGCRSSFEGDAGVASDGASLRVLRTFDGSACQASAPRRIRPGRPDRSSRVRSGVRVPDGTRRRALDRRVDTAQRPTHELLSHVSRLLRTTVTLPLA